MPQDDKYGLSQALLSNLSEFAPERCEQCTAHRDVCGECLQEKRTSGLRCSLSACCSPSWVTCRTMPQFLWLRLHATTLSNVAASLATPEGICYLFMVDHNTVKSIKSTSNPLVIERWKDMSSHMDRMCLFNIQIYCLGFLNLFMSVHVLVLDHGHSQNVTILVAWGHLV